MSYTLHLLKKMLLERGITDVLFGDNDFTKEHNTLKGLGANSAVLDDLCKPLAHTVKTKPLYTQLLGRWGK